MKKVILLCLSLALSTLVMAGITNFPNGIDAGSSLEVDGDTNLDGALDVDGATNLDDVTIDGILTNGTQSATVVTASSDTTITPTNKFIAINANVNAITFSATPLLATATLENYQEYIIYCSSNDITLQDADTLTGSGIELVEGNTLTLSKYEWCRFISIGDALYQDGFARTLDGVKTTIGTLTATTADSDGMLQAQGFEAKDGILSLSADQSDDDGDDWRIVSDATDGTFDVKNDTTSAMATRLTISAVGEVTTTALEGNDASITLQADESDDNGDDWKIESDQSTNKLIISNDTSGAMVEKATINTSGDLDVPTYVLMGSSNVAMVPISYVLDDTGEIALEALYSDADGKAGFFCVYLGTHSAQGVFTSAGVPSLAATPSGDASTSDNNDGTLNVIDNGDCITFENQTGAEGALWGYAAWQE